VEDKTISLPTSAKLNVKLFIIGLVCLAATVYIYLNSFELLFNKDVAFATSIQPFRSENVINQITKYPINEADAVGDYGTPEYFKLGNKGVRFEIIPYIKNSKHFLVRENTLHAVYMSSSKNGHMGDVIFYASKNWRTIDSPEQMSVDDNFFIDTKRDWRYMYRISDTQIVKYGDTYTPSDTGKPRVFVIIDDSQNRQSYVVQADFVNLQNIEK
jgi:hypothetical protein